MMNDMHRAVKHLVSINAALKYIFPHHWRDTTRSYTVRCPFHSPDHTPSLRINIEKNIAICYGACNHVWDPVQLWAHACDISIDEAISEISKHLNLDLEPIKRIHSLSKPKPKEDIVNIYSQSTFPLDLEARNYITDRGLSLGVAALYGTRTFHGRLLFPHVQDGIIYALSLRSYINQSPSHLYFESLLGNVPFGIDKIDYTRSVVVVESPICVLTLRLYGVQAVAIRIAQIDDRLLQILSSYRKIVIMLDGDRNGRSAAEILRHNLLTQSVIINLPDNQDPNSLHTSNSLSTFLSSLNFINKSIIEYP